jgi:hypothetical protein
MNSVPLLGTGVISPVVHLITLSLYRLKYPGSRKLSGANYPGSRNLNGVHYTGSRNLSGATVLSATESPMKLFTRKTLVLQSGVVQIFANDSNKYKLKSRSTEKHADYMRFA